MFANCTSSPVQASMAASEFSASSCMQEVAAQASMKQAIKVLIQSLYIKLGCKVKFLFEI